MLFEPCVLWTTGSHSNNDPHYVPDKRDFLIVPYKQRLWLTKNGGEDNGHSMYQKLQAALKNYTTLYSHCFSQNSQLGSNSNPCPRKPLGPISIKHSAQEFSNHDIAQYRRFPAVIFIPYQTSVMTFFELYRQNIPIFAPSLNLLVEWQKEFNILDGRIYGWPKRYIDIINNLTSSQSIGNIPEPNIKEKDKQTRYSDASVMSYLYWLKFSDIYIFPHVMLFDSWDHLMELIKNTDLKDISFKMLNENKKQKLEIMKAWDEIFKRLAPHRSRGYFNDKDEYIKF